MPKMKTGPGLHDHTVELARAVLNAYPRLKQVFEQHPILYSSKHAIVILAALHGSNLLPDPLFERWLIDAFCYGAVYDDYLLAMRNVSVILLKHNHLKMESLSQITLLDERNFVFFGTLLNSLEANNVFLLNEHILGLMLDNPVLRTLESINNDVVFFGYDEVRILSELCDVVRAEANNFTDETTFVKSLNVFWNRVLLFSFLDVDDAVKRKLCEHQEAVQYICGNAMYIEQFARLPETTQDNMLQNPEQACAILMVGFRLADFLIFSVEMQIKILNCKPNTIEFISTLYYACRLKDTHFLSVLLDERVVQSFDAGIDAIFLSPDEFALAVVSTLVSLYIQQPIRGINVAVLCDALSVAKAALHPRSMAHNFFTPKKQIKRDKEQRELPDSRTSSPGEKRTRTPSPAPTSNDPLARELFRACTPEPDPSLGDRGPSA